MQLETEALLGQLIEDTRQNINRVEQLSSQPVTALTWKATPETWNVLECLEHLNRYGRFYLPEVKKRMSQGKPGSPTFDSGWLGNYFVNMIAPKPAVKTKTMKTMGPMNPNGQDLDTTALDVFIQQQYAWLDLFDRARNTDLTRTRTKVSFTSLIRLRLGDTLRFVVAHNQRHLGQAERAVENALAVETAIN